MSFTTKFFEAVRAYSKVSAICSSNSTESSSSSSYMKFELS